MTPAHVLSRHPWPRLHEPRRRPRSGAFRRLRGGLLRRCARRGHRVEQRRRPVQQRGGRVRVLRRQGAHELPGGRHRRQPDAGVGRGPVVGAIRRGPGRGIAQWSVGGRWDTDSGDNVLAYTSEQGESATSLDLQLAFVWYELETFSSYGLAELRASTDVTNATIIFQNDSRDAARATSRPASSTPSRCSRRTPGGAAAAGAAVAAEVAAAAGAAAAAARRRLTHAPRDGFCTATLQCDSGHWIVRQDDSVGVHDRGGRPGAVQPVRRVLHGDAAVRRRLLGGSPDDPDACTSGPGG